MNRLAAAVLMASLHGCGSPRDAPHAAPSKAMAAPRCPVAVRALPVVRAPVPSPSAPSVVYQGFEYGPTSLVAKGRVGVIGVGKESLLVDLDVGVVRERLPIYPRAARFTSSGDELFVAGARSVLRLDLRTGGVVGPMPLDLDVTDLGFSPDESQLLAVGRKGVARLDAGTLADPTVRPDAFGGLRVSHPFGVLYAQAEAHQVSLVDVGSQSRCGILPHDGSLRAMAFSPDGTHLATLTDDRRFRVWRVVDGAFVAAAAWETSNVAHLSWSPDSQRVLFGSIHKVDVFDLLKRETQRIPGTGTALAFGSSSRIYLFSARELRWRDLDGGGGGTLEIGTDAFPVPFPVVLSPDLRWALTGWSGSLSLLDLAGPAERKLPAPPGISNGFFSPDSRIAGIRTRQELPLGPPPGASGPPAPPSATILSLFRADSGAALGTAKSADYLLTEDGWPRHRPDGKVFADRVGSTVLLFSETAKPLPKPWAFRATDLVFSGDSSTTFVLDHDASELVAYRDKASPVRTKIPKDASLVAASHDGKRVFANLSVDTNVVYEPSTGLSRQYPASATLSHDGTHVATCTEEGIDLVEPMTGARTARLPTTLEAPCTLAFGPSDAALLACDDDTCQVWSLTEKRLRASFDALFRGRWSSDGTTVVGTGMLDLRYGRLSDGATLRGTLGTTPTFWSRHLLAAAPAEHRYFRLRLPGDLRTAPMVAPQTQPKSLRADLLDRFLTGQPLTP